MNKELAIKIRTLADQSPSWCYGKHVAGKLYGPVAKGQRQAIMSLLAGKPIPVAKCGITATLEALYATFSIPANCPAVKEEALEEVITTLINS